MNVSDLHPHADMSLCVPWSGRLILWILSVSCSHALTGLILGVVQLGPHSQCVEVEVTHRDQNCCNWSICLHFNIFLILTLPADTSSLIEYVVECFHVVILQPCISLLMPEASVKNIRRPPLFCSRSLSSNLWCRISSAVGASCRRNYIIIICV